MSVYCPYCGWKQRKDVLVTSYHNGAHTDIVYSFRCEFCNEKIRAELQDTKLGELL